MYYLVQNNIFDEFGHDSLVSSLENLNLEYELVNVLPFVETLEIKTDRKDIFPIGSVKLARIAKQYDWTPGSQLNSNHDFLVYKDHYKENLLNYDSKIIKLGDNNFFHNEPFFARPTKDSKAFTGRVFDMEEWNNCRDNLLTSGYEINIINKDLEIQISSVKKIFQEIRFFIVNGEPVTASRYKLGRTVYYSESVDPDAYDFCRKMINLFQLNKAFVMDLALTQNGYKIIECGCINCAGFYKADMQKLLMALEKEFDK